jgi:hypothetical protein
VNVCLCVSCRELIVHIVYIVDSSKIPDGQKQEIGKPSGTGQV